MASKPKEPTTSPLLSRYSRNPSASQRFLPAEFVFAFLQEGSRALAELTFGDGESNYIKKSDCSGDSFEVGQPVVYGGRQCVVNGVRDGDYGLHVRFAVTIDTTMTEADFSGANLGVPGAMILAAWLEHKVRQHTA
jgi:hypothetical protein